MVDYLRAECYKVSRRRYLWNALAVMAVLEAALVGLWAWGGDMFQLSASNGFAMVTSMLSIGYYATAVTGDMVFSEQYKHNTLKNEVSYGLPRTRIYLGKLAVACAVSLCACLLILLWYAALCNLFLPGDGAWGEALRSVGFTLLCALPLWLGAQAVFHMCFFTFRNSTAATLTAMVVVALLGQFITLLSLVVSVPAPAVGELLLKLHAILLTTPLDGVASHIGDWAVAGRAWCVGVGWFAAATALGLLAFRRREIS